MKRLTIIILEVIVAALFIAIAALATGCHPAPVDAGNPPEPVDAGNPPEPETILTMQDAIAEYNETIANARSAYDERIATLDLTQETIGYESLKINRLRSVAMNRLLKEIRNADIRLTNHAERLNSQ